VRSAVCSSSTATLACGSPDWMITDVRVSPVKERPAMSKRRGSPA
jgi:hypothetical protein